MQRDIGATLGRPGRLGHRSSGRGDEDVDQATLLLTDQKRPRSGKPASHANVQANL